LPHRTRRSERRPLRALVALCAGLLTAPAAPAATATGERAAEIEARIAALRERTARSPAFYPLQAELAALCLERARATLDPAWVGAARQAARASLAVQESYEGFAALAGVEAFAHRFDACLEAAEQADAALPEGGAMLALRVECLLGGGRETEARALVEAARTAPRADGVPSAREFYRELARAALARAAGDTEAAGAAYLAAAEMAARQRAVELRQWALVEAAGLLLDSGRPEMAAPLLAAARAAGPPGFRLEEHEAELLAARGDDAAALAAFERLRSQSPLPELRVRAWRLAEKLSRPELARVLFAEAEAALRAPVEAGELYTLEMLARLELEAGVRLDEALALARRNLERKKDRAAHELLRRAEAAAQSAD